MTHGEGRLSSTAVHLLKHYRLLHSTHDQGNGYNLFLIGLARRIDG